MNNAVEIVVSLLVDSSGVGAVVADRIYPVIAPQASVMPNIVVTQISEIDDVHLAGTAAQYPVSRISVISRGRDATEMMNVSDAVKAALRNVTHQTVGSGSDVSIHKSGTDVTQFYDNPNIFEQTIDFLVRWRSA